MRPRSEEKADEAADAWLPPEEADRRRDDALRRALSMPPVRKDKGESVKGGTAEKRSNRREEQ